MNKTILIAVLVIAFLAGHAQEDKKLSRKEKKALREAERIEEVQKLLEEKNYVFSPTQALPSGMRSRNLDGTFSAKILSDSIYSYLPFYGRAYSADYGSTDGPFTFDLPTQNYSMEKSKKGYTVKFDVKNKNDNIKFMFQIGETGSATLNLTSTNRQTISYYGNIEKPREK